MKKLLSHIVSHLRIVYLLLLMSATVALILVMFPSEEGRVEYDYSTGAYWHGEDLYAPYDITILKSEAEQARDEAHALEGAMRYYAVDTTAVVVARERLGQQQLSYGARQLAGQVLKLVYSGAGYCGADTATQASTVVLLNGNVGRQLSSSDLKGVNDVYHYVWQAMGDSVGGSRLARLLVDSVLVASARFDAERTHLEYDTRLAQAARSARRVQQGELIVAKGQRVDEETALALRSLEAMESARRMEDYDPFWHYFGQALLCVIAFVALYMFLKNIRHPMLEDLRKVAFAFFIVILISAVVAFTLRANESLVMLAPICIVPILMRVFFDMRVALYIHIVTVIIIGNMVPNSYEFIFYQLIAGMMSIITVRNFERRSSFFTVAMVIFATYSLIYVAGMLSTETSFASLDSHRFVIFFLNAVMTLLAYPLIFLFERLFGLTTNLTLMEISSTNTPALRELSQKAPGTFQHSVQVANIAEDLIAEIGGNALLAKVGGLYHDIGKMEAPLYFTENQMGGFNPHDNIDYEESAHIITQHVPDGIRLAKHWRLPSEVTDFIRTHHGTTVTGYFYAKAQQQHPDGELDLAGFRYPGPKPYSRETAVVMLVDSVEAACKSLKVHDKESIDRMVDNIVDDKMRYKQLDNCPLTLRDMTQIRTRLKERMMSIYHVRIAYPLKNKE